MIINTKEKCVEDDADHDHVLKCLRLCHSETLKSEAVNRFNWDHFGAAHHQKTHKFDPLFLRVCEISRTLSLFNLLVELVDNDRNEQVHDEEGYDEDVQDE